jgi:hypothetical protein
MNGSDGIRTRANVDSGITRFPVEGSGSLSGGLLHHGLDPGASATYAVMTRSILTAL